jgi:hypothetical protein
MHDKSGEEGKGAARSRDRWLGSDELRWKVVLRGAD